MSHLATLLAYLDAGLSIVPIRDDGSKAAAVASWAPYQEKQPTRQEVERWVASGHDGWALVCGAVSDNVECIDFDAPELFDPWSAQIDDDLLSALVLEQTPRGGWHVFYRCREIGRNQALARRLYEGDERPKATIETRGEGGYAVVDPTPGRYHEAGNPWRVVTGALTNIREISPDERATLLDAARMLNEYVHEVQCPEWTEPSGNGHGDTQRPGDDFAAHTPWRDILEPHGWRALYSRGDKTIWQRPGKDGRGGSAISGGESAKTGFSGLYVYSSNAFPFNPDRGYSKFSAYAVLNHGGDVYEAAKALRAQGWGPQVIIRPRATPPIPEMRDERPPVPDTIEELMGVQVPELPESARVDPALGRGVCPWLDEYVAFSRLWSPRAFDDFHTACALWLLSAVAARRLVAHVGGPRYSNLYIALVARTSLWAKSTTAKIVQQALADAGLSFLLAPDDSTPQRFISDLVLRVPPDWDSMEPGTQQKARLRLSFPAARGWFYEELGQKMDAMLSPGGFMADFRGILRTFDDCPAEYQYASIGRGLDAVQNPYIAMLGNMTPSDMQRATQKSKGLWQDGFWARWAFVTPPGDTNSSRSKFPTGERVIPRSLVDPIKHWHTRLGTPDVSIEIRRDSEGKNVGYDAVAGPTRRTYITLAEDAIEAYYAYHDGLLDLVEDSDNRDFDGNYARFAEKALRVAILLGSLSNGDRITLPVWAKAQGIAERWRRSLHELYEQANEPPANEQIKREEQAMQIVTKLGEATAADVARYARSVSSSEMAVILDGLVHAGALVRVATTRRGTIRYALAA